MAVVTLPPPDARPERYSALKQLCSAGLEPARIIAVYGAGDGLAARSADERGCETVLWVSHHDPPRAYTTTWLDGEVVTVCGFVA